MEGAAEGHRSQQNNIKQHELKAVADLGVDTTSVGTAGVDAERVTAFACGSSGHKGSNKDDDEDDEEEENFYAEFDRQTKALYPSNNDNGNILQRREQMLCEDLSEETIPQLVLTAAEKAARNNWKKARANLKKFYKDKKNRRKVVDTPNLFLEERVVPPLFSINNEVTYRNKAAVTRKRHRNNPLEIFKWDDFEENVNSFIPVNGDVKFDEESIDLEDFKVFEYSLAKKAAVRGEIDEEQFHKEHVLANLRLAGLLSFSESQEVACHGLPDYILHDGTTPRVAIEYNATHNLPLPMNAVDIVRRYANGRPGLYQERNKQQQERDQERVCDTLGQLFRYMAANGLRCGALTSASRTYFCFFKDDEDNNRVANKVCVSDAWFVGQENYLRAWAYLWSLSTSSSGYQSEDVEWNISDVEFRPSEDYDDDDDDDGGGTPEGASGRPKRYSDVGGNNAPPNKISRTYLYSVNNLPTIPFTSIQFLDPLGYGRNGCVFRARWEEMTVAVKQFDVGRSADVMERFCMEKYAYKVLRDVQGILIPKALFLAESSAGIMYLGLQLGRKPDEEDDISGLANVLEALKSQYGFTHEDQSRNNCLFIPCEGGKEKLVAIDLEDYKWEKVEKHHAHLGE